MRIRSMATKEGEIRTPCEYRALQECLERNQGSRDKCQREWREFQNACANNKRCVEENVCVF